MPRRGCHRIPDLADPVTTGRSHPTSLVVCNRARSYLLVGVALAAWTPDAHAQRIPWIVLPLAASPILAVLLCAALGVVTRSWSRGLGNTALVAVWVTWFWAASNYSDSDWLVWASVLALGLHSIAMAFAIGLRAFRRARGQNGN